MNRKTLNVLMVEDDEIHAEGVRRAFRKAESPHALHRVVDGVEALAVLRGETPEPQSRPDLVLLDLSLPRMSGLEFLEELRQDERLRRTVVFVFTTSQAPSDMTAAYDKQVAGYLVKGRPGTRFSDVTDLVDWYSRTVDFPPE